MGKKIVIYLAVVILLCSCTNSRGQEEISFQEIEELKEIRPLRPVKIKFKRHTSGKYSWEITGEDEERIITINKRFEEMAKKLKDK